MTSKSPRMGYRSRALFQRSYRLCPPANARALTSSNGVSGLPVRFRVSKMVHTASSGVASGSMVTGNAYFTSGSMHAYSIVTEQLAHPLTILVIPARHHVVAPPGGAEIADRCQRHQERARLGLDAPPAGLRGRR